MQPKFAQRKVYIHESNEALIDELIMFPRNKHDDCLDSLYYAMKQTYAPQHSLKPKEVEKRIPEDAPPHVLRARKGIDDINRWLLT